MKKSFCDYVTSIGTVLNIKSAIATGSYSIIFLRVSLVSPMKRSDRFVNRVRVQHVRNYWKNMKQEQSQGVKVRIIILKHTRKVRRKE